MRATAVRTNRGTIMAMVTVPDSETREIALRHGIAVMAADSVAVFKYDPEEPSHTDEGWEGVAIVSAEPSSSPTAALVGRIRPEVLEVLKTAAQAL
jgi:hypothetical protein